MSNIFFSVVSRSSSRIEWLGPTVITNVERTLTIAVLGYSDNMYHHPRCQQLKLEPIEIRRIKLDLFFVYRLISGISYSLALTSSYSIISSHNLCNKEDILSFTSTFTNLLQKFFSLSDTQLCGTDYQWNSVAVEPFSRFRSSLDNTDGILSWFTEMMVWYQFRAQWY